MVSCLYALHSENNLFENSVPNRTAMLYKYYKNFHINPLQCEIENRFFSVFDFNVNLRLSPITLSYEGIIFVNNGQVSNKG
jgi:hypothetical protein